MFSPEVHCFRSWLYAKTELGGIWNENDVLNLTGRKALVPQDLLMKRCRFIVTTHSFGGFDVASGSNQMKRNRGLAVKKSYVWFGSHPGWDLSGR